MKEEEAVTCGGGSSSSSSSSSSFSPHPMVGLHEVGPPPFLSKIFDMVEEGGTSTLGERSTTDSCMLRSGRMNRSRKGID